MSLNVSKTSRVSKYSGSDKVEQRGKRPSCTERRAKERERQNRAGVLRRGGGSGREGAGQPPIKGRTPREARVAAAIPVYLI